MIAAVAALVVALAALAAFAVAQRRRILELEVSVERLVDMAIEDMTDHVQKEHTYWDSINFLLTKMLEKEQTS